MSWRCWRTSFHTHDRSLLMTWFWVVSFGLLTAGAPAVAEPPPRLAFSDGSIPPPFVELGRDLLGMTLVLQEVAPYFTGPWKTRHDTLDQHLQSLASLLEDAPDAGPEADGALRRAIAYGQDLASFNLSVLLCERSRESTNLLISNEYGRRRPCFMSRCVNLRLRRRHEPRGCAAPIRSVAVAAGRLGSCPHSSGAHPAMPIDCARRWRRSSCAN